MVVHGAVDSYSRLPVYLSCSDNNRTATVLELFKKAVYEFGYDLPARIRCDKGVENYDVAMSMLTLPQRESTANPVLVGKSVHNQRIERLWRDVYSAVICTYYYQLEDMSLLDPSNSDLLTYYVFIWCLFPKLTITWRCGGKHGLITKCQAVIGKHHSNYGSKGGSI